MTHYLECMTMLSFRVEHPEAVEARAWAKHLGMDRSELMPHASRVLSAAAEC